MKKGRKGICDENLSTRLYNLLKLKHPYKDNSSFGTYANMQRSVLQL